MSLRKIENPELFRSNIQKHLNTLLHNENYSTNLEKGIFNYTLNESKTRKIVKKWDNPYFVQLYVDHLRSILANLGEEMIKSIQTGQIKPHIVAFMNHQELCPKKWESLIVAKSKRDMNKFETNIEAATDTFICRKCKSNKCTYYLQQVRSADEPMTCYIQCTQCGKRWKQN
jgi:transcription elongation factor S-II